MIDGALGLGQSKEMQEDAGEGWNDECGMRNDESCFGRVPVTGWLPVRPDGIGTLHRSPWRPVSFVAPIPHSSCITHHSEGRTTPIVQFSVNLDGER